MATCVLKCGFMDIDSNGYFNVSSLNKGKLLYESNHVVRVCESRHEGVPIRITGSVIPQTNISKPAYSVILEVNESRKLLGGKCSCKAGLGSCKHKAAVLYYINNTTTTSKTAEPQTWGKPSLSQLEKYKKGKKICDMFPSKIFKDMAITKQIPDTVPPVVMDISCPLQCILAAEELCKNETTKATMKQVQEKNVYNALLNALYEIQKIKVSYISANVESTKTEFISEQEWKKLCSDTVNQAQNEKWLEERRLRITSTKAHRILTRQKDFEALAAQFMTSKLFTSAATNYGNKMEPVARKKFEDVSGCKVTMLGLCVDTKQPWLACSPDGIINSSSGISLLEIKCPITCQKSEIVNYNNETVSVPYLYFDQQNVCLKKKHTYYTQIQVALYVLGLTKCHLYVYSPSQGVHIIITREESFLQQAIPKLESFYFRYMLSQSS